MRPISTVHSKAFAGAVFAAALTSHTGAQTCLWSDHAPPPISATGSLAPVYDEAAQRVLFLRTTQNRIWVWAWNGVAWTLLSEFGPPARSYAAAVYDSARNRVVLFGGQGPAYLTDTWEWDGTLWIPQFVSGPPGRWQHSMTYDQARQKTVLFGGFAGTTALGDTWVWNGQEWTLAAASGPPPRGQGCMAYDSLRARTVLYGGYAAENHFADLWEWDGSAWLQRKSTLPGPRGVSLVFDRARARMILGREINPYPAPYETWELDTASALWTLRDPASPRTGAGAFDAARLRAVFGSVEYDGTGSLTSPAVLSQSFSAGSISGGTATMAVQAAGSPPLSFQWFHNGQAMVNGGHISGVTSDTLILNPTHVTDNGAYHVAITNACATLHRQVGELRLVPACYPNCDDSSTPPVLTSNDFACFMDRFAAGDMYADCDGSHQHILTANDFQCFANSFVAGCS